MLHKQYIQPKSAVQTVLAWQRSTQRRKVKVVVPVTSSREVAQNATGGPAPDQSLSEDLDLQQIAVEATAMMDEDEMAEELAAVEEGELETGWQPSQSSLQAGCASAPSMTMGGGCASAPDPEAEYHHWRDQGHWQESQGSGCALAPSAASDSDGEEGKDRCALAPDLAELLRAGEEAFEELPPRPVIKKVPTHVEIGVPSEAWQRAPYLKLGEYDQYAEWRIKDTEARYVWLLTANGEEVGQLKPTERRKRRSLLLEQAYVAEWRRKCGVDDLYEAWKGREGLQR